ncbi:MAG: hypothetical protein RL226_2015, partial [Bacteroidota bacterium]
AIVAQQDTAGFTYFTNRDGILQKGLEGAARWRIYANDESILTELIAGGSFAIQRFHYNTPDEDTHEKSLPGIPLATVSTTLDVLFRFGGFIGIQHFYNDRAPLNDLNTGYSNAYHLVNARVGVNVQRWLHKGWRFSLFLGSQNVFNAQYSGFLSINAAGGRYFNPAPPTNYYGGVTISKGF